MWFSDNELKNELYTQNNFHEFTGRKKRGKDWNDIETFFEKNINYDWKVQCKWNDKIFKSGKNQFDISFGYEIVLKIPFNKLKELDTEQAHLHNLTRMIEEINQVFNENLLNTRT